jgi:hypothetical protein
LLPLFPGVLVDQSVQFAECTSFLDLFGVFHFFLPSPFLIGFPLHPFRFRDLFLLLDLFRLPPLLFQP